MKKYEYDIALSFAGEDRLYVEKIARKLKQKGVKLFYDTYEQSKLWGKDLYVHLDEIYRMKSRYCIIFISKNYKKKLWTNHERESAQARAFKENKEYILPIKIDDTEIPGIKPTTGYLSKDSILIEDIVKLIIEKIGNKVDSKNSDRSIFESDSEISNDTQNSDDYVLLRIEKGYGYTDIIVKKDKVSYSENKVNIASSFNMDAVNTLSSPKINKFNEFDNKRWIIILIDNRVLYGKVELFESFSENEFVLHIGISHKNYYEYDFKTKSDILRILNIVLFNRLEKGETGKNNIFVELQRNKYSYKSFSNEKSPYFVFPFSIIPDYYNRYLKTGNWLKFFLFTKFHIIGTLDALNIIDVVEELDFIKNENNSLTVKFQSILNIQSSYSLLSSKVSLEGECDLSMDNYNDFWEKEKTTENT